MDTTLVIRKLVELLADLHGTGTFQQLVLKPVKCFLM